MESASSLTNELFSDRYEILEVIGQGGMGIVYKARHVLMKRMVAIKMLHESLTANELAKKRFEQEAQAISALNHPNILTVYDFGVATDSKPYLVVELLEGHSLDNIINEVRYFDQHRAVNIFKQICAGLAHAHEKGVVHRDIKPSNFMLVKVGDQDDFLKIVDFGIAKMLQEEQRGAIGLTVTGQIFGSPLYMSPEQCCGQAVDQRSDIYSLGCVMYLVLTGCAPFSAENLPACIYKQVNEKPSPFAEVAPHLNLPPELENIVMKAMEKEPSDRYQSMAELEAALAALDGSKSQSVPTTMHKESVNPALMALKELIKKADLSRPTKLPHPPLSSVSANVIADQIPVFVRVGIVVMVLSLVAVLAWNVVHQMNPKPNYESFIAQGNASFVKSDYALAEKSYLDAIQSAQQIKNGQPKVLSAVHSLYKTYVAEESYDKLTSLAMQQPSQSYAIDLLNEVLEKVKTIHGKHSLPARMVMSDLAKLYAKQGNLSQADKFYKASQEIERTPLKQRRRITENTSVQPKSIDRIVSNTADTKNLPESNQPKKRGVIKSIGKGFAKVFGVFGHHHKDNGQ